MNEILKRIHEVFNADDFVIRYIYDLDDSYLFYIARKDAGNDEILDPWYTINKKTKKIAGFVVHLDFDKFEKAMGSKPVYTV